jgi:hypothetical protein
VIIFTVSPSIWRIAESIQITIPRCWVVQQHAVVILRTSTELSVWLQIGGAYGLGNLSVYHSTLVV